MLKSVLCGVIGIATFAASPALATPTNQLVVQGSTQVDAGTCTEYKVISDNYGTTTQTSLGSTHPVTLTVSGIAGKIYSDSGCTSASPPAVVSVGSGTLPAVFYMRAPSTAGSGTLAASLTTPNSAWASGSLAVKSVVPGPTVQLEIQGPAEVNEGTCTKYQVVADKYGTTTATSLSTTFPITLSSSGVALTGYSNAACTVASPPAVVNVGSGTTVATFYVLAPHSTGSGTLTAKPTTPNSAWVPGTLGVDVASPTYLTRPPSVSCSVTLSGTATGDQIASALANSNNTVICLDPGVHRLTAELTLPAGKTLYGYSGASLNGSVVITPVASGSYSIARVPGVNSSAESGHCADSTTDNTCYVPNDVYVNSVLYPKVSSLSALTSGHVYLNTSTLTVYFSSKPSGTVEYSNVPQAITGDAGSTVEGLLIEKFANNVEQAAVNGSQSSNGVVSNNMTIAYNEVRFAHGHCVSGGPLTAHNYVHHCGLDGLSSIANTDGAVFEYNEVAYNLTAGFDMDWFGGGAKFWISTNTKVQYNYVHDNYGRGLWTDTDNTVTYQYNIIANNWSDGILHEVSHAATIVGNTITGNGAHEDGHYNGFGIQLDTSDGSTIENNTLSGNKAGIGLVGSKRTDQGVDHYLMNNIVKNNSVDMPSGAGWNGIVYEWGAFNNPCSAGNKFTGNTYTFNDSAEHFVECLVPPASSTSPAKIESLPTWEADGYQ